MTGMAVAAGRHVTPTFQVRIISELFVIPAILLVGGTVGGKQCALIRVVNISTASYKPIYVLATLDIPCFEAHIDPSTPKGRNLLITSGLGAHVATKSAEHEALVTIADINEKIANSFIEEQRAKDLRIGFIPTSWPSQIKAFHSSRHEIDIVIATARVAGTLRPPSFLATMQHL